MEESSISKPECSPSQTSQLSVYSQAQGSTDIISENDVFPIMLHKIQQMGDTLKDFGKQYSHFMNSSMAAQLNKFSRSQSEEYSEVLYKQNMFIYNLNDVTEGFSNLIDVPKCRIHYCEELSSRLNNRHNEVKQEIHQTTEEVKKLKAESKQFNSQISMFSKLIEEPNDYQETQEFVKSRLQFEEVKRDMEGVLIKLFPDIEVRTEFSSAVSALIDAYVSNLKIKEDQFAELQPHSLKNKGLLFLLNGCVIVCHPLNPRKFRLFIEE